MKKNRTRKNFLIIASSLVDADLFYVTRFVSADPFIFIQIGPRKTIFTSDLELDRAKSQARVHQVLSVNKLTKAYEAKHGRHPEDPDIIEEFARKHRVREFLVPANFPAKYLDPLRRKGLRIKIKADPFFKERTIKTHQEIKAIRKTLCHIEASIKEVTCILRKSAIRNRRLYYRGKLLKSETLKTIINVGLMKRGCTAVHSIVACGKQSIDPHHEGSGPLYANQPIIIDIFPRDSKTRYFADFTRTVVRGKASPKLKRMYAAVREAQKMVFELLRDGVDGSKVHEAVQKRFENQGFKTGMKSGHMQGFFHGTGHGLGLDIHERPRIGPAKETLKAGQVVTVEPGLYYQDTGGVRLEDLVVITKTGCHNLTRFPKVLEIR